MIDIRHGDCLDIMKDIPDNSVDLICTDPPYAVTEADFDTLVDIDAMWVQLNRIIKPRSIIVLCCQQPFTTDLINGNRKNFKQALVWEKAQSSGFLNAKHRHMPIHEDILIFNSGTYNPQMRERSKRVIQPLRLDPITSPCYKKRGAIKRVAKIFTHKFPTSIIKYAQDPRNKRVHPHQKPVELMEYLIKTYSNEGDTVLDFTIGSGSTGVAAVQCGRNFIGIEMNEDFYNQAKARINDAGRSEKQINDLLKF